MKTINIAVCDDEKQALSIISMALTGVFAEKNIDARIEVFEKAEEFVERINKASDYFDVIMLDIRMPRIDGISLASKIRERDPKVKIVFVSSEENRVFDAFLVNVFYFIRKSNLIDDINNFCNLYVKGSETKEENNMLVLKQGSTDISIAVETIKYVESERYKQNIYLSGKKEPTVVIYGLDKIEEMLKDCGFLRIHKAFLVNNAFISKISSDTVTLISGEQLLVSRRRLKEVRLEHLRLVKKTSKLLSRHNK
ncbi:MAG: response regulator transcription factor [Clostridia bacterium]|nr:response regulator transcription factor [Clostridia bacterium]